MTATLHDVRPGAAPTIGRDGIGSDGRPRCRGHRRGRTWFRHGRRAGVAPVRRQPDHPPRTTDLLQHQADRRDRDHGRTRRHRVGGGHGHVHPRDAEAGGHPHPHALARGHQLGPTRGRDLRGDPRRLARPGHPAGPGHADVWWADRHQGGVHGQRRRSGKGGRALHQPRHLQPAHDDCRDAAPRPPRRARRRPPARPRRERRCRGARPRRRRRDRAWPSPACPGHCRARAATAPGWHWPRWPRWWPVPASWSPPAAGTTRSRSDLAAR